MRPQTEPTLPDVPHRSTPELGAVATAALLVAIGVALTAFAHATALALFQPSASIPSLAQVVAAGPGPVASIVPFVGAAFFHVFAILATHELRGAERVRAIVGIDVAAVTFAGLALGQGHAAAVLVLGLALALAAALGHGGVYAARRLGS
ncbi:MAG: hypothetical protein KC619_15725 [Myxococcales bacterium]|nr:hypothetical protein [Myxococcales bacterium]